MTQSDEKDIDKLVELLDQISMPPLGTYPLVVNKETYDVLNKTREMTNHTEVLNYIIEKKGYKSYLEIGTYNGVNFNSINCEFKTGVDPDPKAKATVYLTSDEFFKINTITYDIIFLDGLHHSDQLRKDFVNAMNVLSDNGIIIIHDSNPAKEEWTHVPRNNKIWWGDVYKFVCNIGHVEMRTLMFDEGITVIKKSDYHLFDLDINWETFDLCRNKWLHATTIEQFKEWL